MRIFGEKLAVQRVDKDDLHLKLKLADLCRDMEGPSLRPASRYRGGLVACILRGSKFRHPSRLGSYANEDMREVDLEWNGEQLKNQRAGELPLITAWEHPLSGTGQQPLSGAGERLSFAAGEVIEEGVHPLNGAGQQPSSAAGKLPSSGAGEQSSSPAREVIDVRDNPLSGAGQQSLTRRGAEQQTLSELSTCETGDHAPQQGPRPHEPASNHPRLALLVFFIVALNVGVFFVTMYINNCPKTTHSCFLPFLRRLSFQPLKENALMGPSSQTLERMGALNANKVQHVHQGWRLVTCMWLHAGVVHVVVNMLSLLFVGVRLEQEFGPVRIGIIYLLSGFGGSLLSVLFIQSVSVGASGALFGLVGAMLAELLANWTIYMNKCAVMSVLVLVVAANLAMGVLPFVDNFAHIGGLIVGFLSGLVLLIKPQYGFVKPSKLPPGYSIRSSTKAKYNAYQCFLWAIGLFFLIAGVSSVAVLVFRGEDGNKRCSWCHYLSCVPTSKWKCNNTIACDEVQVGNMWQITCTANQKITLAPLNETRRALQELCTQLCS